MYIKSFIKKYKELLLIIIITVFNCIIYWNYLKGHFSTESYGVALGYKSYGINVHLVDGRIFSCLLFVIADLVGIPIKAFMSISCLLGIIIGTIAVWKLKDIISKLINATYNQELIIYLTSYTTIFNFMLVEILYFPETCIMVLSILLYIISANFLIEKRYLLSSLILLLGIFCYQGTIGFFIVCGFLFTMIKNKDNKKEIILDILHIALIGIMVSVINLIFIKLISIFLELQQHKSFSIGITEIKNNIIYIFYSVGNILINNCGLFPKYLLLINIGVIVIYTLCIMKYEKNKKLASVVFIILVTIASSFIMFLIQNGSMYTGRVHFCIGSIIGISLLYIYSCCVKKEKKIFLIILTIYCIINCLNTLELVNEHQKVNQLEKEECMKIENIIEEHEEKNDVKVIKIVPIPIPAQKEKGYFEDTRRKTVITYNQTRHYWGYSGIIQYYLRRDLKNMGISSENNYKYQEYINENNLEYGDFICIEDTLYCPQYIF